MAYSEDREGLLGEKFTAHFDDQGNKTGESRKRERLFGGEYSENSDATGQKVSESTPRQGLFGDEYLETRDRSGRLLSTSREKETLFGEKVIETRNAAGEKIGESRHRKTLFGPDGTETTYVENRPSSESGDGYDALFKLVFWVVAVGVAFYFCLINLPGWMGSVALSATIAYFYALFRWREIKKQPEAGALIEQTTRKGGALRYEVAASFAQNQVRWFPDRLLLLGAGLLFGVAYAYVVARSTLGQFTQILVWIGPVVGAFAAHFVGTAILRRRLNELVLREERLPATHYAWPTLTGLILSIPTLLLILIGMVSSATSPRPVEIARAQPTPVPSRARTQLPALRSQITPAPVVERTPVPLRSELVASARNTPAPFAQPSVQGSSEAEFASTPTAEPSIAKFQPPDPIVQAPSRPAAPPAINPFKGEVFPQTRTQYLTAADVASWSAAEAQFAINEMFARHGAEFGQPQIRKWFSQFEWYRPRAGIEFDTIEAEMTPLERDNIRFLGAVRDARRNAPAITRRSTPVQQRQRTTRERPPPNPVAQKFLEAILRGIAEGLEKR